MHQDLHIYHSYIRISILLSLIHQNLHIYHSYIRISIFLTLIHQNLHIYHIYIRISIFITYTSGSPYLSHIYSISCNLESTRNTEIVDVSMKFSALNTHFWITCSFEIRWNRGYTSGSPHFSLLHQDLHIYHSYIRIFIFILLPRIRLEALSGLIRPPRRKPKCDRTATRKHLLPLVATGRDWMPLVATGRDWMPLVKWQVLNSQLTGVPADWWKARCQ
jgi:hypothetical protein